MNHNYQADKFIDSDRFEPYSKQQQWNSDCAALVRPHLNHQLCRDTSTRALRFRDKQMVSPPSRRARKMLHPRAARDKAMSDSSNSDMDNDYRRNVQVHQHIAFLKRCITAFNVIYPTYCMHLHYATQGTAKRYQPSGDTTCLINY